MSRKLVLYVAMSLDGYIAKRDGNIDFLSSIQTPAGEDYGYANFVETIDTVIWGRKTFDKVLTFGIGIPYKDKKVYVISRSRQGEVEHAVYRSDVVGLVRELKMKPGKDIYCDGGSEIIFELLKHGLIDRMIISVIPHLLGDGIRLFKDGGLEKHLVMINQISFPSGLVQLWYDVG